MMGSVRASGTPNGSRRQRETTQLSRKFEGGNDHVAQDARKTRYTGTVLKICFISRRGA